MTPADASIRFHLEVVLLFALAFVPASRVQAVERVRYRGEDSQNSVKTAFGELLVEAQDGGVMLQSDDGRITTIQPSQILDRATDETPLSPLDAEQMAERLMDEMPAAFQVYRTSHYLIVHNTNEAYVRQVGELMERLYKNFYTYWKNQRWKLPDPRFPLVALVLSDRQAFNRFAEAQIGETAKSLIGYYHLETNWVITFRVPNLERNVATLVHEATHQLAYNCGLQTRFADNPMWVSEGLATYFEATDVTKPMQWRRIGLPNAVNLRRWKLYLPNRPQGSLATLISDDLRYRSSATAQDAYAEGWALTYFLIKTRREKYVEYLRQLSEGKPLIERTKRERIEMFESVFGEPIAKIDRQLVAYINRIR
ncbi:MAG: DUF1570 domain-containing protein [Planctomycetota bacterium]